MSNTAKRILVGIIGIPIFLFLIYKGGIFFLCLSVIITTLALWELYSMFETKNYSPLKMLPIVLSILIIVTNFIWKGSAIYSLLLCGTMIFAAEIFRKGSKSPLNSMISVFGIVYITIPFICLNTIILFEQFNFIIYIFILIWTCDTMAFFGGKYFGKHKLSEISPKKTWEGSITGFLFTMAASYLFFYFSGGRITLTDSLVIGLIVGIFSQVGDLFESLIKRKLDVKDSSQIIPGHGGVLDRFDSLIFVAPLVLIYFYIVNISKSLIFISPTN